jgi:FkbM family methyltransferase
MLWYLNRFLKSCNTIIHVGANRGQERQLYESHGLSVVWIEPIPAIYEELVKNIAPYPRQIAIQALLTDKADDLVQFHIANNSGASSSILDLALHKDLWPEITYIDHILLRTETLERLIAAQKIRSPIDALILDTQGSELLVLKGAEVALSQANWVKVEAAEFESYRGGATVETICEFLKEFSYYPVRKTMFAKHPSGKKYYDLLLKKFVGEARGDLRREKLQRKVRAIARNALSEQTTGMINYYRLPERKNEWGGPFNGQRYRQQLFKSILSSVKPAAIIETGTYLGATTAYMARERVPIYTIESQPHNYGFARARLWWRPNVTMRLGDSRAELQSLLEGPLRAIRHRAIFVYLDAHWKDDLPLREELHVVFSRCSNAVVMVDDFEVPGDSGFGYDDYGVGKVLNADYLASALQSYKLTVLYPAYSSTQESGARRGCVVLCNSATHAKALNAIALLRMAPHRP